MSQGLLRTEDCEFMLLDLQLQVALLDLERQPLQLLRVISCFP